MTKDEKIIKSITSSNKWQLYDLEKDEIIAEGNCLFLDRFLSCNQDKIDLKRLGYLFLFRNGEPWGKFKLSYKVVMID